MTSPGSVPEHRLGTEYLANERTFLAWIRTAIAVISLGFVMAKFGVWLGQLQAEMHVPAHQTGVSLHAGAAMMAFGGLLAVLAAWRYHVVNVSIARGMVQPDRGLIAMVTILVVGLALGMTVYVLAAW